MNIIKRLGKIFAVILVSVLVVAVALASSVALGYVYMKNVGGDVSVNPEDDPTQVENKKSINVLLLGTNQNLSDFIMVARYDAEQDKAYLISIPRDTKYNGLDEPHTTYYKINAIYQGKNIEKLENQVEKLLGIKIDNYVVFNTSILKQVVDAIGGVTVDIGSKPLKYEDPEQNLYIDIPAGVQTLDGDLAEQFVRFRKGYSNGDIGRINAQHHFIEAFIQQCLKPENLLKLPNLASIVLNEVKTDIQISTVMYYLDDFANFKMENLTMETLPGYSPTLNGISFYVLYEQQTKDMINKFFFNKETEEGNGINE
ncbi:MAG: LCP family protein [Clostridia bacterium]|nr:LCP family protein [Clostridia bacterium]